MRCLIIDEHPVVRQGVRSLLAERLEKIELTEATALDTVPNSGTKADVVIIDPRARSGGIDEIVLKLEKKLGAAVVVFSSDGGARQMSEALKAGVKGYVRKDSPPEDLIRAIEAAARGEFYVDPALSSSIVLDEVERTLTPRQREILQMLADGMQTDKVAKQLGLSTETVRTHTKRILAKLDASTRTAAVAIGIRSGMIE